MFLFPKVEILLLLILTSISFIIEAKSIHVNGVVKGIQSNKVFFIVEGRFNRQIVDSCQVEDENLIQKTVQLDENCNFMYIIGNNDLANNGILLYISNDVKKLTFSSYIYAVIDSMKFEDNKENETLYNYFRLIKDFRQKFNFLNGFISQSSSSDPLSKKVSSVKKFLIGQFEERLTLQIKNVKKTKSNFELTLQEYLSIHCSITNTIVLSKSEFPIMYQCLKRIDESKLVYSNLIQESFDALVFQSQKISASKERIKWIDNGITNLLSFNDLSLNCKQKLTSYYIGFLKKLSLQEQLQKLFINYPQCVSKDELMELAVGSQVEGITGLTADNRIIVLSDLDVSDKVLLIWSPSCSHCRLAIHDLNEIRGQTNIKFYSYSISNEQIQNTDSLNGWDGNYNLMNGSKNSFLQAHNINYTPFISLLDHKNKIKLLPVTVYELKDFLIAQNLIKH